MTRRIDKDMIQLDRMFFQTLQHSRLAFCITDCRLDDHPIIFANPAFMGLTGYPEDEIVGRNCRFLQGPATSAASVAKLRDAIAAQRVETIDIVNYRKNGEMFVNALQMGPIYDDDGTLTGFFGSQMDVTEERDAERRAKRLAERELSHRLLNIVNVFAALIKLTAKETMDTKRLTDLIIERIQAVGTAHLLTFAEGGSETPRIREVVEAVLQAYAVGPAARLRISGPDAQAPDAVLTIVSILLHELATNAVKYGALSTETGVVDLVWRVETMGLDKVLIIDWKESGGPLVQTPSRSSGSQILAEILEVARGSLNISWEPTGVAAIAILPLGRA